MKAFILSFFVLLFSSASVCAQEYFFRMHRFYGAELYGTTIPEYSEEWKDKVIKRMKRKFLFHRNKYELFTY